MYLKAMKVVTILLFLIPFLINSQEMKEYRWHNRVVILVYNDHESNAFQQQLASFDLHETDLKDRDMILLTPKGEHKRKLLVALDLPTEFQGVLLVGKDGGLKFQGKLPVPPETLFALVDTMPMRRAEMKRKKGTP